MFFVRNGYAAVFLLVLIPILVSASLDNAEDRTEISAERIFDYVTLPWMAGRDWLLHSSESSRVKEVQAFIGGVESGEIWATKMLDALWKNQKEIPARNIQGIRTHDQSIEVNAQHNHIDIWNRSCEIMSRGIISMVRSKSSNLGISSSGFDAPSKDKPRVVQIASDAAQGELLTSELNLGVSDSLFSQIQLNDLSEVEIATIIFFMTIGALIIGCTICDIARRIDRPGESSTTVITLSKFSLYTNALAILSTEVTPDMMPAIHGIRFLSCCSIIFGHRYAISVLSLEKSTTLLDLLKSQNSWYGLYSQMAPYAVDTFLLISGFLAAHLFFKSMQSGRKFNLPRMYLHRYFRITPCLAMVMLFATVFLHRAGSGPLWADMVTRLNNHCRESWWIHFLYAQNLVENGTLCLPHFWSLATDMQLFWISPVILYPLHKCPRVGLGILSLCFVASVVTPAITLAINGYWNAVLRLDVDVPKCVENFGYYYGRTYNRACPYLVGILLGYDVATKRRRLTQINVVINWLVTGTVLLLCLWLNYRTYNTNFAYDSYLETISAALSRPSWAFAMAWIVYACTQGYGGMATRFLSLPIFFPLSRLTFCMYLIHFGAQTIMIFPLETSANYLIGFGMLYAVCVDLVVSIAAAFVLSLFIEIPGIVLEKILMNHGGQAEQTTPVKELKKKRK